MRGTGPASRSMFERLFQPCANYAVSPDSLLELRPQPLFRKLVLRPSDETVEDSELTDDTEALEPAE